MSKIETGQISASLASLQSIAAALSAPMTSLFAAFEEQRDCSFVKADQGVVIERRGSKVGHVYQLLGHALGGDVAVEPYLITLEKEAAPYTAFQHAGREFIYMLTGLVDYRHGDKIYRLGPGDSLSRFERHAWARGSARIANDLSVDHHLSARPGLTSGFALVRRSCNGAWPKRCLNCREKWLAL